MTVTSHNDLAFAFRIRLAAYIHLHSHLLDEEGELFGIDVTGNLTPPPCGGQPEVVAGKIVVAEDGQLFDSDYLMASLRIGARIRNPGENPSQYSTVETSGSLQDLRFPVAGIEHIEDKGTVPQS